MSEFRHTQTGEVQSQGQWRKHYKNVSLPRTWTPATLEGLNLEPVIETPMPSASKFETVIRNGVTQDDNGKWVTAWEVVNMFTDTTENGVTTTKAEHEAAHQTRLDADEAKNNRTKRDGLLAETDYFALTDVTMDAAMTTYRQALRDITAHENWPNLEDANWPTKP
jgi:hypothetical protein